MPGCCGIDGCGACGICGTPICGMPIRGIPGIGPPGGVAAGGAPGGGGARFAGVDIIRVYSPGPCGVAAGVYPGVTRNAWVALPPGPYEAGGAGGGAAGGAAGTGPGAPDRLPGPNMRVYSPPDACWAGGGAGAGAACGNCDAEGNCGPTGIPPGDGLKNSVNSPPLGGAGPASGSGVPDA